MTILSIQRGMNLSMHSNNTCNNPPPNQSMELWPCMGTLAFVMEREVQWCKSQIRDSQKEPFAHLMCKELHCEQIHIIMLCFDLENELDIRKLVDRDKGGPKGMTYDPCMYCPYTLYLTRLNRHPADNNYEFLPPSK